MLWTSDTSQHDIYFLKRGQVSILLNDSAGCEVIVRVIKPGELFGELCFCSQRNQPRDNCAQAVVDSEVFRIDLPAFLEYLQQESDALEAFTFTLCKRLADAENRIEVLSHRSAEARLGRLLLQLAGSRSLESAKREGEIKLEVGHDELARMAAMTRPHVSVTMSKLRGRGLVHYGRGSQLTVHSTRLAEYLNQGKTAPKE
ncbi:MAG: Crp/Fnr family transcriptional regulator [Acidobacteriota bacterium]|nr:Crp/Fnr family transcriptional regulator [Acidobacteriota bacterium]